MLIITMKSNYSFILLLALLTFSACTTTVHSEVELLKVLAEQEEMYGSKTVGDFEFQLKYLPVEVFVYRALERDSLASIDSVKTLYENNITFIMVVKGIKKLDGIDLIRHEVDGEQPFKDRIQYLNFESHKAFELYEDDGTIQSPLLVRFENTYGLSKNLVFNVVFRKPKSEQFNVAYYDNLFATGKSKFSFKTEELNQIPDCEYTR